MMKILGVFLLSLLTFVCSQPLQMPYVESIEAIESLTKQLEAQIMSMEEDLPDITDPRRHYAILVTHLVRVAKRLNDDSVYPVLYIDELPNNIVFGLMNVDTVAENTREILEKVDNHTDKLQALIDTLCTDTEPADVCNQIVDQAVRGDPQRYEAEAKLMLLGGKVAEAILDADLVGVAEDYDEQAYLINNVEELQPLIFSIARVIEEVNDDE